MAERSSGGSQASEEMIRRSLTSQASASILAACVLGEGYSALSGPV